jgi:mRNA-degrading endonuclease YafQ of YafQ-DinJ toxin-antitoxin module
MVDLEYSSDFLRKYKKLEPALKEEVRDRLEEFRDIGNHRKLKVHALKGSTKGVSAFSVNYSDRIVFEWSKNKKTAYILGVGDHSIYE